MFEADEVNQTSSPRRRAWECGPDRRPPTFERRTRLLQPALQESAFPAVLAISDEFAPLARQPKVVRNSKSDYLAPQTGFELSADWLTEPISLMFLTVESAFGW